MAVARNDVHHVYHDADAGAGSGWGLVAAFVAVIALIVLALYFIVPAVRSYSTGINVNVPDRIQVETSAPATDGMPGGDGSSQQ